MDKTKYNRVNQDVRQLQEFVNEVCDSVKPEKTTNVYRFNEADILTQQIYDTLKAGDIILVNQMSFIVAKPNMTPHTLMGSFTFGAYGEITANQFEWVVGSALSITPITLASGTKLYKHHIKLDSELEDDYIEIVVPNDSVPITSENIGARLIDLLTKFIGGFGQFPNSGDVGAAGHLIYFEYRSATSAIHITVGTDTGVLSDFRIIDVNDITDTVTEL